MTKVEIKIVGESRLVECLKPGIQGAGYRIASNCRFCQHYLGEEVETLPGGLVKEGYIKCGRKARRRV